MIIFKILNFNNIKKNNSENACNYDVEMISRKGDKSVYKGVLKFTVKPKDIYTYDLKFVPNAEETFEVIIKFHL